MSNDREGVGAVNGRGGGGGGGGVEDGVWVLGMDDTLSPHNTPPTRVADNTPRQPAILGFVA